MDFEHYLDTHAALLGLEITPDQRPGVVRYLQLAAGVAARVEDA